MDDAYPRRWPWVLIAAGALLTLYSGLTDYVLEVRERDYARVRSERRAELAKSGAIATCGTPDPPRQPTRLECLGGVAAGLELALAGVCVLARRVLWKRRGGLARVLWATFLLSGIALQALTGYLIHLTGLPPDPELLLWMFALAPAFVIPFVGLSGCYLAKAALTPA